MRTLVTVALPPLVILFAAGASASPRLRGLELGNLGGTRSAASAANDFGQVAGWADTKGSPHAFLWSRGKMTDLGTLGSGKLSSAAYGINKSGQVVGESARPGSESYDAFLWSKGKMLDLGTLAPGDPAAGSGATAVNDSGQVVGLSDTALADLPTHGFLWSNGTLTDLGTLGSPDLSSSASDINNSGQIVGGSDIGSSAHRHAFLWTNGKMTDLGALGGAYSESSAAAINDSGQIVGTSWGRSSGRYPNEHAFLWSKGVMTDLGTLGGKSSDAEDISSSGEVVGGSQTRSGHWHAFVWFRGEMTDLGTLGSLGSFAIGVNTSGDIVGAIQWEIKRPHPHAVLWTAAKKLGWTAIPNLRGMTLAAAHDAIARAECSFGRLRRDYSTQVKAGRVISQSSPAGRRVLWGTKINLVISRGRGG